MHNAASPRGIMLVRTQTRGRSDTVFVASDEY